MDKLTKKYLQIAKSENRLISLRTNTADTDKFSAGYVINFNNDLITFKSVTRYGIPDGIITIQTDDLYGIDFDDKYLIRLEKRINGKDYLFEDVPAENFFLDSDYDLDFVIEKARKENLLVYVSLYNDLGFYGYILELSDTKFAIKVYNEYYEYDGISIYLKKDIKSIMWKDIDIKAIELLK